MSFDTRTSEYPTAPQSEALVRRILSVAEILARHCETEIAKNEPENRPSPELRYRELEMSKSES